MDKKRTADTRDVIAVIKEKWGASKTRKSWEASKTMRSAVPALQFEGRKILEEQPAQTTALTPADRKRLDHTLKFLVDPLRFSDHIRDLLAKKGDEAGALELVRYASKTRKNTVAWNHIVAWYLKEMRPNAAMKIFNEMKKRAQWPDSYTYMHLLRFWDSSRYSPRVLHKALNIYHSMTADNSRVEQRTIHSNLALKICNRLGDMDSFWGVASKMPERGVQSADSITYSIILNALRHHALDGFDDAAVHSGNLPADAQAKIDEAVSRGCRIWADVVAKWRSGDLKMDDALVCAMGRLLLLSSDQKAWQAVLSLVEHTENLSWATQTGSSTGTSPLLPTPEPSTGDQRDLARLTDAEHESSHVEQFAALLEPTSGQNLDLIFAQPTNNTLSLVLAACEKLADKNAADAYWSLLTADGGAHTITPDADNYHTYLRVMRKCRGSGAHAVRLVREEMAPRGLAEIKSFRIAMSACVRPGSSSGGDNKQTTSVAAALADCAALVDAMLVALPGGRPHVPTLIAYARFARLGGDVVAGAKALHHFDKLTSTAFSSPSAGRGATETLLLPWHAAGRNAKAELRERHGDGGELVDLCRVVRECIDWVEGSRFWRQQHPEGSWRALRKRCEATERYFGGGITAARGREDGMGKAWEQPAARGARRRSVSSRFEGGRTELPMDALA